MKRTQIIFFLTMLTLQSHAQVTIEECYAAARTNYPLIKQLDLIERAKEFNLQNAGKGYLPQVNIVAQASWQSDVPHIPLDTSNPMLGTIMPDPVSKDQYKAVLELSQVLWDGGRIKSHREMIESSAGVSGQNVEVNLYHLNERIDQLYFGILLIDAQLKQNKVLQDELERNHKLILSYVDNGIANQSDLNAVRVDQLKAFQTEAGLLKTREAYIGMLGLLTGMELSMDTQLIKPEPVLSQTREIKRPELELYELRIVDLNSRYSEIRSDLRPKLGLFLNLGYGRPGLNMLDDSFNSYYIGGVQLAWNLGSLYRLRDRKNLISTNIESVKVEKESFLANTMIDLVQKDNAVRSLYEQLSYDDEIISLLTEVRRASEAKIAFGTISGSELMRDLHAEQMAIQNKIVHETQLLMAIYNLRFITNDYQIDETK